ncbi:MAG TPA: hypothetical protein VK508_16610 [Cyclobacteriaceae bacterium]|nr:hypothetical protein [Cyclobacteriaceae bacterium]
MFYRILICLILLIVGHSLVAQNRPAGDPLPEPSTRKASHYIGLQANQLLRQLISFGGNSSPVTNPYLLVYSVNSLSTGFGFATGLGYSSIQTKSNDNFTNVISKVNDFAWRFGLEKKKYLSKNWLISFGGDILIESSKAETTSTTNGSSSVSTVITESKRSGFGPRASLNYQFHNRLLVGTEASYYFKWINQKQTSTGTGQPNDNGTKLRSFSFSLPAVVFLIMKF